MANLRRTPRYAYFGDPHIHTDYSFDACAFSTVATPYDAYRYAKGDATTLYNEPKGSYARDALKEGLVLADVDISLACQFGFVGATDPHTGAASLDETNYFSKVGALDANGGLRGSEPLSARDAEVIKAAGRVNVQGINSKQYATGAYET